MYFEDHLQPERPVTSMNKSVENLLVSSHEVITSINSSSLTSHSSSNLANGAYNDPPQDASGTENERNSPNPSPSPSPKPSPRFASKKDHKDKSQKDEKDHKDHKEHKDHKDHKDHKEHKDHKDQKENKEHKEKDHKDHKEHKDAHTSKSNLDISGHSQKDSLSLKFSDQAQETTSRSTDSTEFTVKDEKKPEGKKDRTDRSKKKAWYSNILYPTYKSRSADFKRIFKDVPNTERLIVDYSCALQREILVHGRLYVSQNYVCFYANIFTWETLVTIQWKDVTSMTKEKTALVIPNAILVSTASERFFFTSFGSRDKTFMMLFKIWQNVLMGQIGKTEWKQKCKNKKCKVESMSMSEMWQLVHDCYGEELGLTSDDDEYPRPPTVPPDEKLSACLSIDSFSEVESKMENPASSDALAESPLSQSSPIHSVTGIRPEGSNDPTDLSDSSESEEDKPPLKIGIRPSTAVCSASHSGRLLIKATLPIHIDQLFTLLFTNSKFFLDFHTARKTTDLVQPTWSEDTATGQKLRTVSLTISLSQTVGPRSSQVTETQVMLPCSSPGHLYCIDVEANNAGIPYADSFSVFSHYCISSISENESSFAVYSEIKYKKNVWGLVKSFIEKNCWAGMQDYFNSLIKALAVECEEIGANTAGTKRKTRRRRRVTAAGVTIQTHSPDHSAYNHQPPVVDVPHTRNISVPEPRGDNSALLSWVLLAAVLCLMIVNGLLYYKLYSLEEAATYTIMDLHVLKNTPKTEEDWINLLQQQESLHNVEIKKWQRVLHTAAQLLRQTEESLTQLQMSIHPTTTEKMFSVLKPGLKTHSPQNEQPRSSEL